MTIMPIEAGFFLMLYTGSGALMLLLHLGRGRVTLAPAMAFGGLLTFLIWQIAQTGWWIDWGPLKLNAAVIGLVPAVLMGILIIYAMDGVRAARAYILIVLTASLFGVTLAEFLGSLSKISPIPSVFYLSIQAQLALVAALMAASFVGCVAYEALRRSVPHVALPAGFCVAMGMYLLSYSVFTYGFKLGLTNLVYEMEEYLLATSLYGVVLLVYGLFAVQSQITMPARPVSSIFSGWQSTEQEISKVQASVLQARHTIAELKRLNEALATEQDLRTHQVENSPLAILEVDNKGCIRKFNAAAQGLLGKGFNPDRPLILGVQITEYLPGFESFFESQDRLSRVLPLSQPDHPVRSIGVTVMPIRKRKHLMGFSVLAEDVTHQEHERFKQTVSHRVKQMHMTGRVLSHDFSNLLTAIQSNLTFLQGGVASENIQLRESINAIRDATNRGREMLAHLGSGQTFQKPELKQQDLSLLVEEAIRIQGQAAREAGIELITRAIDKVYVDMDTSQISRVLVNLIGNAIRATEMGGKITVLVEKTAQGAIVKVKDTGCGMTQEQVNMAFDPAFSTKGSGQGGLGLAISYLIVDAHGGRLSLDSLPDIGTTATVWLPLSRAKEIPLQEDYEGQGVLLLLPEEGLRQRMADYFVYQGYDVAELVSVEELQAVLKEDPDSWSLVVYSNELATPILNTGKLKKIAHIVVDAKGRGYASVRPGQEGFMSEHILNEAVALLVA